MTESQSRLPVLLFVSLLLSTLSISGYAGTAVPAKIQAQLDKYTMVECGEGLENIKASHNIWAAKTTAIDQVQKYYADKPDEKKAVDQLIERSAKTKDPYVALAIKSYFEVQAIGAGSKKNRTFSPIDLMSKLDAGTDGAAKTAFVFSRTLENLDRGDGLEVAFIKASGEVDDRPKSDNVLDPTIRSDEASEFEATLMSRVIGQKEALRAVADMYQVYLSGMSSKGRPVGNLLFLGPTGTGKTRVMEAAAEILFGDPRALIKIDSAEFQHSHEIAKLVGSPPGYLGHRETHPLLTQEELAKYHTEKLKLSFVLFDEIEKASDALWQLLLGILDKATLTLGDNRRVDFSDTMIVLTSNVGSTGMNGGGSSMGFAPPPDLNSAAELAKQENQNQKIGELELRKKFSPEFLNRMDKIVVFHPLNTEQLAQILEIELGMVQQRLLNSGKGQFLVRYTDGAKAKLLQEGTDQKYGARHLKRAIERLVVYKLSSLLATDQVAFGDKVVVDYDASTNEMTFTREGTGAIVPAPTKKKAQVKVTATATAATGNGGKTEKVPGKAIAIHAPLPEK